MTWRTIWCSIAHRAHWYFYGYGDWRIQRCGKCDDVWVVPYHQAKGPRKEPLEPPSVLGKQEGEG